MADLTSLYRNKPKRDQSIQACADCLNKIAIKYPDKFPKGYFTDYFDISGGTQPPKSKFIHEPKVGYVRFLQIRDFASEATPTFIPIAKNNKLCSNNDLVLGRYGASVGKILTGKSGAYNVACAKIIFLDKTKVDREFLFYWLHSSYFQNFLTSISRSAQGGFNKNDLSRIQTYFPSVTIQKKFVNILKAIDSSLLSDRPVNLKNVGESEMEKEFVAMVNDFLSIIHENEELTTELTHQQDLVKQLRQAFLREAMQGKLVKQEKKDGNAKELLEKIKAEKATLRQAQGKNTKEKSLAEIKEEDLPAGKAGIPFAIPENWVWCRLGEMSINCDGARVPISQTERERRKKVYDYYGASGVIDKIDGFTHEGKYLLIGEDGANLIAKSTPIAFIAEGKFWVNNHAHVLGFYDDITFSFMQYCLNAIDIKPFITGGFQPKLSQGNLNLIPIPLPPLAEQNRIVKKLEQLMHLCDELQASIQTSKEQNEMLLQQVLREALQPKEMEA